MSLWMLLIAMVDPSFAEDEVVIRTPADLVERLPPPDATRWDATAVVQAIAASPHDWSPADVYELVDRRAHEDVVRAVCREAGELYDERWQPLDQIAAQARQGQAPQTLTLTAANFRTLFTTLAELESDVRRAAARVPTLAPQKPGETQRIYERRVRRHAIDEARAKGPAQGRIDATTFDITLPVAQANRDGCTRPVAAVDVSDLPFATFRAGMGVPDRTNPVEVSSSTIEHAEFSSNQGFRFEVWGDCGKTADEARLTISRTWNGQWSGRGDL